MSAIFYCALASGNRFINQECRAAHFSVPVCGHAYWWHAKTATVVVGAVAHNNFGLCPDAHYAFMTFVKCLAEKERSFGESTCRDEAAFLSEDFSLLCQDVWTKQHIKASVVIFKVCISSHSRSFLTSSNWFVIDLQHILLLPYLTVLHWKSASIWLATSYCYWNN